MVGFLLCITIQLANGPTPHLLFLGGHHNLDSYGTVMLFAAGIGITHQVPYVRSLVTGYANNTVACRKLTLVWIIQSPGNSIPRFSGSKFQIQP